jgi:hypothetical protein
MEQCVETVRGESTNALKVSERIIERVKENIKEGECPICCLEFEDIIITKCCNVAICAPCLEHGFKIKIANTMRGATDVRGKCPSCMRDVSLGHDLVFVTRGVGVNDLMDLTRDRIIKGVSEYKAPTISSKEEQPAEKTSNQIEKYLEKAGPKMGAFHEICHGRVPQDATKRNNFHVNGLVEGDHDNYAPEGTLRKIMVFAQFDESLSKVKEYLNEVGYYYIELNGTHNEMHGLLSKFRAEKRNTVLLVNSNRTCAGMDIQFATDLVFFHRISSSAIEAQLCGRAQRVGRVHGFRVFYLLYENENY